MSVKVIAQLDPFSLKRDEFSLDPKPIADIIKEINSGFPASQARVSRNGEIVTDFSTKARDGDILGIKFVPAGNNQEIGVAEKVLGATLIVAGIIIAAVTAPTGLGPAIGAGMIGSGIGVFTSGVVSFNSRPEIPSVKDYKNPENDPSIRGGKNQSRPYRRIPVLFGRHRLYPDLAANPHTEIIGNNQYYTQLFCGGYRDCVIDTDSFKLGETPLVDLSQTKNVRSILSNEDSLIRMEILQNGEASDLYPHCVHEDAINAVLKNQTVDGFGNTVSGEVVRTTPGKTDTINVDIFFFNGIGKYNNDGDLQSASVEVRASYKLDGEPDSAYRLLGYFSNEGNTISGKELKTKRCQITKDRLAPGQYSVKVERVTPDSTDSKTIDQVYVGSIRSIKSTPPVSMNRRRELTIIALRVMATPQLNGVVESFNYVATANLPVYTDGGSGKNYWLSSAETRNPASALLYALRGRASQQAVDPNDIDWPALEGFFSWCAAHNYHCDAYLSEPVTIAELLRMIGSTARADILRIDSKISVVQDIERVSPVQLFTPKNTKSYSVTMLSADVPDAIALRFIDDTAGYAQNELLVYNTPTGNRVVEPQTIQKVDLWGITNSDQSRRIGMYNYACIKNRPFVHTIEADIEYLLCNKGDWIQYAGDIALTGSVQGRITGVIMSGGMCGGFRLDEPAETQPGNQYALRIRKSDGTILFKDVAMVSPPDEVYLIEPIAMADAPAAGDLYAFGIRGREVLDLIVTDIQPQADLSATLVCVEYSPEIFHVDEPGFVLPDFDNRITPVSGAIDSGVITPDQWQLFTVYHDDEDEPPRPDGDGQSSGWHYAQSIYALWQSSKMAASVMEGEWGPPVRIRNQRGESDIIPVYITLSTQNKILECDGEGNLLAGTLPFTVLARLIKWNTPIGNRDGDIVKYPGTDGNLFNPMPGGFFPSAPFALMDVIAWSLRDAPPGVTINQQGYITVSADAVLDDKNSVIVEAKYQDDVYRAFLLITKDNIRRSAPGYLGTVTTLPTGATITIIKGPSMGQVRARQGDFVLTVASGPSWQAGRVYQWSGFAWEYRSPDGYSDLYIRCFKDGLDVPELIQDVGWFGAIFVRLMVAQQAFIEELETQVITLKGGGVIQSEGYKGITGPTPGFRLDANGDAEFNNATFRGHVEAVTGMFHGRLEAEQGYFHGIEIRAGTFEVIPSPEDRWLSYNPGTKIKDIWDSIKSYTSPASSSSGENEYTEHYDINDGNTNGATSSFNHISFSVLLEQGAYVPYVIYTMDLFRDGNYIIRIFADTINLPININIYSGKFVIRMTGLPTMPGTSGSIYAGADKILRVSP